MNESERRRGEVGGRRDAGTLLAAAIGRASVVGLLALIGVSMLPRAAAGQLVAEAAIGEPFGVASVTIPIDEADRRLWLSEGLQIVDPEQRCFYPAFSQGTVRRFLGEVLGQQPGENVRQVQVFFLFRGAAPFEMTIETTRAHRVVVRPARLRRLRAEMLRQGWWREFVADSRTQGRESDYPPAIETYLVALLGRRMGLEPPLLSRREESESDELRETLELLMGVEALRYRTMRATVLGEADRDEATLPLPADIAWGEPYRFPDEATEASSIEPIAMHVPEECLYVRFGSWSNQIRFKGFLKGYGEDLSRLVALRGYDARLDDRMQEQIGIVDSQVTDLLGGNLIADVALIGFDTFLREGAAMGIVLQQRNGLLGTSLSSQRSGIVRKLKDQGAIEETLEIGGRKVSFISTPDNRLRSFWVSDGDFHLMTNSRRLVERFLEAGQGLGALGDSDEFRWTRQEFPLDRNDSVFAYLSSALFRNLLSPQYQIELRRRLESVTDIELVHLARAVARAEGIAAEDLDGLIEAGLLPEGFGRRPDGSGPILAEAEVWDSMRGRRGYFLPIADVRIDGVTERETQAYLERSTYFASRWGRLDPLVLAVKFVPADGGGERLEFEARLAPFGEEKYGWLFSILGPPMETIVEGNGTDVVNLQASVRGGLLIPGTDPHRLFVTLQDEGPSRDGPPETILEWIQVLRSAPGYLGASPKPGFLDLLPIGLGAQPDPDGYTKSLLGIWRWQGGDVSLLSFDRERLWRASEELHYRPLESPAHVHLRLGEVGSSALRPWVEQAVTLRAKETTVGNVRLLGQMVRQLKVAPESALAEAERLLDVTFRCALDGEFRLEQPAGLSPRWRSSHLDPLADSPSSVPEVRLLDWLAEAEASLRKETDQVAVWGYLTIRDLPRENSGSGE